MVKTVLSVTIDFILHDLSTFVTTILQNFEKYFSSLRNCFVTLVK